MNEPETRLIPLSGRHGDGQFAIVDKQDFELYAHHKWHFTRYGYAARDIGGRRNKKKVFLHRLIARTPEGIGTDHINRNPLDNRRSNLRWADQTLNLRNASLRSNNKSGVKGVFFHKRAGKWQAGIKFGGGDVYLGLYRTIEEAAQARAQAEVELWGTDR